MLREVELIIYMDDDKNTSLSLTPTQIETIFKALGIRIDNTHEKNYYINMFADNSLREKILPKINLKEIPKRKKVEDM